MEAAEKVAYLKGLVDGQATDPDSREGKILAALLDALEGIVDELETLTDNQSELESSLDAVSDDLADVEDICYNILDDDDASGEDESGTYAVTCPGCGETIVFDGETLEAGDIVCPGCGHRLVFAMNLQDEHTGGTDAVDPKQ